jgi:hypothetical protein
MNGALARCIVGALRVAGSSDEHVERLQNFSQRDWDGTLPWLDDSGLALYLLERARLAAPQRALPDVIRTRLEGNLANNQRRLAAMTHEFAALNRSFEAAGVEYAVMKGFALVPDYCPDASLRSQYDYDYLVGPGSEELAAQTLRTAGYKRTIQAAGIDPEEVSLFTSQPLSLPPPDADFYSAEIARGVELHTQLWQSADQHRINLEVPPGALDRRRLANWEGLSFPMLADEDALLSQSLHTFHHILSHWCRLACFLEIAHLMARRQGDAEFWQRFFSSITPYPRSREVVSLVLSMAITLFGAPVASAAAPFLEQLASPAASLWASHFGKQWALARFPGSKTSLFLHREFVDDPDAWRDLRRNRLFPFHQPARVAEAGSATRTSRWSAKRDQWRFAWARLKFHLAGVVSYTFYLPRWRRLVRRNLSQDPNRTAPIQSW